MPFTVRLSRVALGYRGGATLHTATSGVVAGLDELRLVLRHDGALAGLGASRVNIAYLTGIDPEQLVAEAIALCATIDWRSAPDAWVAAAENATAPVRMLVEMAARDAAARRAGVSLARQLGGTPAVSTPTNQTLFWCDEPTLRTRVENFVARGFTDLKLRVGIGPVAEDLHRLALVREIAGPDATLSVDANGTWSREQTLAFLSSARPQRLAYCEQPLPANDRAGLIELARATPTPVMLDESLDGPAAIAWLVASRAAPLAHLKLAKLGGLDRLVAAGRALQAAGIGVMVGQMNEGTPSTLAAAHAALALAAPWRELYGADGLVHDPAGLPAYAGGVLALPQGAGLGLADHSDDGPTLWETTT